MYRRLYFGVTGKKSYSTSTVVSAYIASIRQCESFQCFVTMKKRCRHYDTREAASRIWFGSTSVIYRLVSALCIHFLVEMSYSMRLRCLFEINVGLCIWLLHVVCTYSMTWFATQADRRHISRHTVFYETWFLFQTAGRHREVLCARLMTIEESP